MNYFENCIDDYKQELTELKQSTDVLQIDLLCNWLDEIKKDGNLQIQKDLKKWEVENSTNLKKYEVKNSLRLKKYETDTRKSEVMFNSVINTAILALKTSLTINAGAATAFLSFIGYLLSRGVDTVSIKSLSVILTWFAGGALCAALATCATYFAQSSYSDFRNVNRAEKKGNIRRNIAIVLVFASYLGFGIGIWKSYFVFSEVDTKISQNNLFTAKPYYINKESL
jgi:hypothetical protein